MNLRIGILTTVALFSLSVSALAERIEKGTPVDLTFDQNLSSRTAKTGQEVRLHVAENVMSHGKVVIRRGTRVTAVISEVHKSGRFGKNGQLKLTINPIMVNGTSVPIQPRQKGNMVGGARGTKAAGAAAAGALVLGPIGLGAGYFVVGKSVNVKEGDPLDTEVSTDVRVH